MPRLELDVPEERQADVLAAIATALEPPVSVPPPASATVWTKELAQAALRKMLPGEMQLMFRLADAKQRRIPLTELSRDLGLPKTADLDHDFAGLIAFCKDNNCAVPVATGGDGNDAWYWLDADAAQAFLDALAEGE